MAVAGPVTPRQRYRPTYLPDGRKEYNPGRTMRDIHEEWDAFAVRVRAEHPDWEDYRVEMAARELWRQEEEKAERFKGWQERVWKPRMRALAAERWAKGESERTLELTKVELERLVEHFAGANDPVARSIAAKASAALGQG